MERNERTLTGIPENLTDDQFRMNHRMNNRIAVYRAFLFAGGIAAIGSAGLLFPSGYSMILFAVGLVALSLANDLNENAVNVYRANRDRDKVLLREGDYCKRIDQLKRDLDEARKTATAIRNELHEFTKEQEGELYGSAKEEMPLQWENNVHQPKLRRWPGW